METSWDSQVRRMQLAWVKDAFSTVGVYTARALLYFYVHDFCREKNILYVGHFQLSNRKESCGNTLCFAVVWALYQNLEVNSSTKYAALDRIGFFFYLPPRLNTSHLKC